MSEYIRSLPLTNEQNDKLVSMMADCMQKFESDAFTLGLKAGVQAAKELL